MTNAELAVPLIHPQKVKVYACHMFGYAVFPLLTEKKMKATTNVDQYKLVYLLRDRGGCVYSFVAPNSQKGCS